MGGSQSTSSKGINWSTGVEQTSPWGPQTQYLLDAFSRANDAYKQNMATGPYSGDYVAQGDDRNRAAYEQAYNFGTDARNNSFIQNLFGQSNNWLNNGSDWMKQGAEGLRDLSGDQTQNIIGAAGQYADNPYISNAVKAAMIDANRQAAESDVPNLYRAAAGGNALNSDRAALSQGVVERGLAEKALGLSGEMRYNAYNSGLDRAASEINARRAGYGSLAQLGQGAAQLGTTGLNEAIQDQGSLNQMSAAGAEGLRTLRQDYLNNEMAKYEGKQNFPWSALQNFYSIVGDKSWGGTRQWHSIGGEETQSTTKSNPGIGSIIGGGLGALGSLFTGGGGSAASGLFSFLGGRR